MQIEIVVTFNIFQNETITRSCHQTNIFFLTLMKNHVFFRWSHWLRRSGVLLQSHMP